MQLSDFETIYIFLSVICFASVLYVGFFVGIDFFLFICKSFNILIKLQLSVAVFANISTVI